jgi:hypothetical protein
LLDRRDINDRETVSALVYTTLSYNKDKKIVNLIDVNSRIAYPIIADQGYQLFKSKLTAQLEANASIPIFTLTDREFSNMFAQIINCDSSLEIFNTPYPLALSNVKFNLNDCEDIDYNIIRVSFDLNS